MQKQTTLAVATANEEDIATAARRMLLAPLSTRRPVRLVGVKVSHLSPAECGESQMVFDIVNREKLTTLHHRLDALREKYGDTTIWWGITAPVHQMVREREERYDPHPS